MHSNLLPYEEKVILGYCSKTESGNLVSYKYTDHCNYDKAWDDVTRSARGIIFNKVTGECLARPFDKFFNLNEMPETTLENLPKLSSYKVYDKLDGSLGIMYWVDNEPRIATQGSFVSDQAIEATKMLSQYKDLHKLNRNHTFLFEIIYPENKIVCNYGNRRELVLLAIRNIDTGHYQSDWQMKLVNDTCGFPLVEEYPISLNYAIEAKPTLNKDKEGFVIVYENGLRLKIKGDEYLKIHRAKDGATPLNIWREMKFGELPIIYKELMPEEILPDILVMEQKIKDKYHEVEGDFYREIAENFIDYTVAYELNIDDKRAIGIKIKEMGPKLKYPKLIFPYFLGQHDIVDKGIMERIRPTGNQL